MNKIFLHDLPYPSQYYKLPKGKNQKALDLIVGFEIPRSFDQSKRQVVRTIFNSLLTHDKICIKLIDFLYIIIAFGSKDALELLKSDYFELIDSEGLFFPIGKRKSRMEVLYAFVRAGDEGSSIGKLEKGLKEYTSLNAQSINLILLGAEQNLVKTEVDFIVDQVLRETSYDLKNQNLTDNLEIETRDTSNINTRDVLNIMRLLHVNSSLVYSSIHNCDNIVVDGAIKPILNHKLSPIFKSSTPNSIEVFEDITNKKGIPDLSKLYLTGVVNIQDIIKIRESFSGRKFRDWLKQNDYNQNETTRQLMENVKGINLSVAKGIRFLVTNSIGLINPVAGITASVVDSFLIDKVLNGWHPNFFLDNILKREIDNKIQEHKEEQRKSNIMKRLPKLGRNDKCPCGSGKKFKHCHGGIK